MSETGSTAPQRHYWTYYAVVAWSIVVIPLFAGFGAGWWGFAITIVAVVILLIVDIVLRIKRKRRAWARHPGR